MGFMNPYVGLKRDDSGYYLDYGEASSSPYYKNNQSRGAALSAANNGGRVNMASFDPYAHDAPVAEGEGGTLRPPGEDIGPDQDPRTGKLIAQAITDGRFRSKSYGRADQQYASDQEVARIAQEGRDRTKQAQLSSEISYAQDAARRASEDQQRGGTTTPGGPDVQLTTVGDNGDAQDSEGGGGARRRRSAYQGSGLKI